MAVVDVYNQLFVPSQLDNLTLVIITQDTQTTTITSQTKTFNTQH